MLIEDLLLVMPEICLVISICGLLLLESFLPTKFKKITYYFALLGVFASLMALCFFHNPSPDLIFDKSYVVDQFTWLSKFCMLIIAFCILIYSKHYLLTYKIFVSEFFVLLILSLLGSMVLTSAGNFLTLYLGMELMALPLYAMIVLTRNNVAHNESAVKYFILGSLGAALTLYGISLIYATNGSFNFSYTQTISTLTLQFGMVFVLLGLFLELGVVPLHTWLPDVYQASPTPVAMMISTIPKIALTVIACRLFAMVFPKLAMYWQMIVLIGGMGSIIIGSIVAIAQTNIKRMLAYSTINNVGFILLGLFVTPHSGNVPAIFYVIVYALTALATFACLSKLSDENCAFDNIQDFQGLSVRKPKIAFVLMLLMISLAGIPPFVGFYAKFMILQALVDMDYTWVALLAMIASVIGVFYYFRIIKVMYFHDLKLNDTVKITNKGFISNGLLYFNSLFVLIFGIMPAYLYNFCKALVI
jgi:NADH-quinone oxidoreductase subunit N